MPDDYYTLLGVEEDASEDAILRAYRERAAEAHPDVSEEPDALTEFQQLNRAKSILTDPEQRRAYDRLGHERYLGREEPPDRPSRPTRDASTAHRPATGRSAGYQASRRGWPRRASPAVRRPDAWTAFGVTLSSTLMGLVWTRTVDGAHPEPTDRVAVTEPGEAECSNCDGRGVFVHVLDTNRGRHRRLEPCERCGGTGTLRE